MFYSVDVLRTSTLEHSISVNSEKWFQRGKHGARIYQSFCNKRLDSRNSKKLLLIEENQISQFEEFNTFLHIGRCKSLGSLRVSLVSQTIKSPPAMRETWVQSLHWEDTLKKKMATHFSILAWRIPCTIQSLRLKRAIHD